MHKSECNGWRVWGNGDGMHQCDLFTDETISFTAKLLIVSLCGIAYTAYFIRRETRYCIRLMCFMFILLYSDLDYVWAEVAMCAMCAMYVYMYVCRVSCLMCVILYYDELGSTVKIIHIKLPAFQLATIWRIFDFNGIIRMRSTRNHRKKSENQRAWKRKSECKKSWKETWRRIAYLLIHFVELPHFSDAQ